MKHRIKSVFTTGPRARIVLAPKCRLFDEHRWAVSGRIYSPCLHLLDEHCYCVRMSFGGNCGWGEEAHKKGKSGVINPWMSHSTQDKGIIPTVTIAVIFREFVFLKHFPALFFCSLHHFVCLIGTKIALYRVPCAQLSYYQFIVRCWSWSTDSAINTYAQHESAPRRRSILIASWWWSREDVINTSKAPYNNFNIRIISSCDNYKTFYLLFVCIFELLLLLARTCGVFWHGTLAKKIQK